MTDQSTINYPLFAQRDATDASKYTSPSTSKTSLYESESPLGAHSSTTSSRLSGSYEPSQVSSMVDELNSDLAHMQTNESATHANASQRPYLPGLTLPSNMPPNQGRPNHIHAPYSNFQSYPNWDSFGSPMSRQHSGYSYGPIYTPTEQHPGMSAQPPFPSPVHYNSPQAAHSTPHPRRASVGVYQYWNYEFVNPPLSPGSPYGYHQHTVSPPMALMSPMQAQHYPASPPLVPMPATRQVRPLVSSPLRPLEAANSSNTGNNSRRQGTALFSSASTVGHHASLLVNRTHRRDQRETQPQPQTPLSSDFKNHKYKRLRDIKGRCVEASKDQYGSRFIQQQFDHANLEDKQMIFEEIVPKNALHLMYDVFGNYVIQKLFEHGTPLQRQELCNVMEGNILTLSLEMYGCRVVQKAIDCGSAQQQSAIVSELNGYILTCVKDSNGNHVIQKLLECVELERKTFIYAFTDNVCALATNPYGCRVLQRCFQYTSQEQIEPLLEELHTHAYALMQDQFGNYVVQFVLEKGKPTDRQRLVDSVLGSILLLSKHKYASNVCEKAIAAADDTRKRLIVEEMLTPGSDGAIPVSLMMKDQFANYVLQKALKSVEGALWDALLDAVLRALLGYRRQPGSHNSKQLASIERLLKEKGVAPERLTTPRLMVPIPAVQEDPKSGSPTP